MSNGVILERLSGRKLSILVSVLLIFQVIFFLIGAFKFPNATHTETVESTMCKDKYAFKPNKETIYYLRDYVGRPISNCDRVPIEENTNLIKNIHQKEIVYAFQIPLPRDNQVLKLHRWFQTMTSVLQLQVLFPIDRVKNQHDYLNLNETTLYHSIPMDVRLAYRNTQDYDDKWYELARGKTDKKFTCVKSLYSLDCDMIQLFELGSVHHEFYTINIKLGESDMINSLKYHQSSSNKLYLTSELPEVRLFLTFIYQTGGFTRMWLIMKSCVAPIVFLIMCWYWNRIVKLERKSNLLERMLFALGLSATILNLPLEWLTLYIDLKWMLLFSDLRQGVFYSTLFTFWIVFCGEHFVDDNHLTTACTTIKSYWKYIAAVWLGCVCLLVFELCQRGMQLTDPFFNLWDTQTGSNIAIVMLILACFSGLFYFGLLIYLVGKVFYNFYSKQSQLPAMNRMRRAFYEGIIYRFKFLLISTLFCAAMTISFLIVSNLNETHWRFDDETPILNYSAGFLTGVYGMWNIYVSAVMIFYAPSHKNKLNAQHYTNDEQAEFVNLQTRLSPNNEIVTNATTTESVLTAFANKISSS